MIEYDAHLSQVVEFDKKNDLTLETRMLAAYSKYYIFLGVRQNYLWISHKTSLAFKQT